jgi:hypothetical protein
VCPWLHPYTASIHGIFSTASLHGISIGHIIRQYPGKISLASLGSYGSILSLAYIWYMCMTGP